jgi:hypothetical protein
MEKEEFEELSKVCEAEFDVFSSGIAKMGFDPMGFSFMILFNKEALTRKKLLDKFNSLTEEEKIAVDNRVKLLG